MKDKLVSVIIPTYKDWSRLRLCIDALSKQSYPKECFEVIIVNNNSEEGMPDDYMMPQNFKLITETKPGSYAARNTGLKIAKGEIIGFTDSDCIPEKDWIKNAVNYLNENKSCSRIAGHIDIIFKEAKPTTAELYNSVFAFPQKSHALYSGTGVTGNMFTYKNVFDTVGPFNERLLSLGDLEWGKMAHKAGFQIHYRKDVVIKHPARTLAELITKERRVGGGQGLMGKRSQVQSVLSYLADNRPRLFIFKHIYRHSTNLSLAGKIKVLLLRHYLLNIRALEKLRVQMGKQASRA